jgi:hypothetical protein
MQMLISQLWKRDGVVVREKDRTGDAEWSHVETLLARWQGNGYTVTPSPSNAYHSGQFTWTGLKSEGSVTLKETVTVWSHANVTVSRIDHDLMQAQTLASEVYENDYATI